MSAINWQDLSPAQFEQIVAVLISSLHPASTRIDGSGGDGGLDIALNTDDSLSVWELKSFVGRLTSPRRRQVIRSLKRAAQRQPSQWFLVVPIDPTPSEIRWFQRLGSEVPFPIHWHGRTWLDAKIAEHPEIPRYFLHNGETEAIQLLRELNREQAGLANGVPDATVRLRTLANRLNEIDPYYQFALTVDADSASITAIPRFAHAEVERPIILSISGEFPNTAAGRRARAELDTTFRFGTPVTVPGEYVSHLEIDAPAGLGGVFENVPISISSEPVPLHVDARLTARGPTSANLASLPITFYTRTSGVSGFVAEATDHSGAFRLKLMFDASAPSGTIHVNYRVPPGALPGSILPALQMLDHLTAPNSAVLELSGRVVGELHLPSRQWLPDEYVHLVTALARIQGLTATYFPVPDVLTVEDVESIYTADKLLQGERASFRWNRMRLTIDHYDRDGLKLLMSSTARSMRIRRASHEVTIGGNTLSLGASIMHLESAKVVDPGEVVHPSVIASELTLSLVPGARRDGYVELVRSVKPEGLTEDTLARREEVLARFDNTERLFLNNVRDIIHLLEAEAQVWLYGSRARGDARDDSDWDLAVLVPGQVDLPRQKVIWDRLYELQLDQEDVPTLDVKVIGTDQMENTHPVRRAMIREGIVL